MGTQCAIGVAAPYGAGADDGIMGVLRDSAVFGGALRTIPDGPSIESNELDETPDIAPDPADPHPWHGSAQSLVDT